MESRAESGARARWRRLRDTIRLYASWRRSAVPSPAEQDRRQPRTRYRAANRDQYSNGVIKRWANLRGRTAATAPILTRTKQHYRQLFALLDRHETGYVHAHDLIHAARQCQIDLSRDQVGAPGCPALLIVFPVRAGAGHDHE